MKITMITLLLLLHLGAVSPVFAEQPDDWADRRMALVEEINRQMRAATGQPLTATVREAMETVRREQFVPHPVRGLAYENRPLPIGRDQTISQPFIVALMTQLLEPKRLDHILEVGTGSGYQAAVLAEIVNAVDSIEIIESLADESRRRLKELGYTNVSVHHGDGTLGLPEQAPFDGIIVTAAGIDIPESLLDQLDMGGRLVMPVGGVYEVQQLKVIERTPSGFEETNILPVRFVPITHDVRE